MSHANENAPVESDTKSFIDTAQLPSLDGLLSTEEKIALGQDLTELAEIRRRAAVHAAHIVLG